MSNKTPKEDGRKTKSARKALIFSSLIFLVIFTGLMTFSLTRGDSQKDMAENTSKSEGQQDCVQIGTECINLEYADSNQERIKGLSEREGLPENGGMIFVFDESDEQCMWMKDMRFPIDILWLDEAKKVVKIAQDVKPESYPETFCADNTKYVLELNSGTALKAGLKQGQTLNF